MKHGFRDCEWGDQGKLCDACIQDMMRTTASRSPLAILCFGFAAVFKQDWGFLPEGMVDE